MANLREGVEPRLFGESPADQQETSRAVAQFDIPGLAMEASRVLNEALMGFLALLALATAIGPLVFDFSPATDRLLNVIDWVVLALFIAEFVVQFTIARDRSAWLRSPWRIVDAICIGGPLLSLLPQVSDTLRGALVLRFVRVGRAVAFGARAGALAVQKRQQSGPTPRRGGMTVSAVMPGDEASSRESSWPDLLSWVRSPTSAWFHASGVDRDKFVELASSAGISDANQELFLDPQSHQHLKSAPDETSLFLWLPTVTERGAVSRNRVLAIVSKTGLLTATSHPFDLPNATVGRPAAHELPGVNLPVRMTYGLLTLLLDRYAFVASRHEEEIRELEEVRLSGGGAQFLDDAFRLQREISATAANLWRVSAIVRKLADGKVPLPEVDAKSEPFLDNLVTEFDGLYKKFGDLKESLKSLMELHMNVTSFEMNKFMKLLAIVGFLGLIPSVAGGLLGMNVEGNPWSVTLGQVAFVIAMGMASSLYVFAIKGWLR